MNTVEKVEAIFKNAKSKSELKKLNTLQVTCNSDSAFLAAVNKYKAFEKILKKAFLLSRTWQKLGSARTWKITIEALAAAFKMLIESFKRLTEVFDLPNDIQKIVQKFVKKVQFQLPLAL